MTDLTLLATARVRQALRSLRIETASWAYANSGTRFKVFPQEGVPRNPYEKIADAATVHRFTGAAPTVALHIPWDKVDDYAHLAAYAAEQGIALGTINVNTFQDNDYMLGSVTHPSERVRRKAVDHLIECIEIMDATGSRDLKLWFSDGTNYPGQDNIRARQDRLAESLAQTYARLGPNQRMLLEYKLFEPACTRSCSPAHSHRRPASRSCSTNATTSNRRSPQSSGR
jgi:L-rhamnose isomerase / sugar isomerase